MTYKRLPLNLMAITGKSIHYRGGRTGYKLCIKQPDCIFRKMLLKN